MTLRTIALAAALFAALPACAASAAASAAHAEHGIQWYKGDVDAAFAHAKKHNKPVFLYWGAVWCPPCNQVKATIFNRQGFIERSRAFVPVYLDGDSPNGQKLGARFKVRGYPTMILFKPDGSEITRLPGEVDGERYLDVLALAMNATRSVKDTLQAALAGGSPLKAEDWRLLADYSWDTDEQQIIDAKQLPATLDRLAKAAPQGESATRLALKAAAAAAGKKADSAVDKTAARELLLKVFADARLARDNMDVLTNYAADLAEFASAPKSEERAQLAAAADAALRRLAADATLSKADRLTALDSRVALARLDREGPLPEALLKEVREQVAAADRDTTDAYERQSVVYAASGVLTDAGLLDESDALLKAELKRSHSPYYHMLGLASNAKKRGDKAAAIDWYAQAYKAAKGPATRLQWGVSYLNGLLELAPHDEARIEQTAKSVFNELASIQNAFYERNRAVLERLSRKLAQWNAMGDHDAALKRMSEQLSGVCAKLPANDPQRATCKQVVDTARAKA
ncbi:MAG TPA: thioredoxin family protein [Paucimonas sp.]|nr:thioredoxin family protein [Paucimonas sp.]